MHAYRAEAFAEAAPTPADKPGEAGLGHAVASSVQGVVPLTPRAQGIERVLIVSLVGGVCTHDDWRGDLPRYFLRFLLRAQAVLLFGRDPELGWKCSTCLSEGVDQAAHGSHRESCGVYLGSGRSIKPADLLIVVGTGHFPPCAASLRQGESCDPDNRSLDRIKDQFPDIKKVFDSPYVTGDTLAIHIPIRPEPEINVGNPFPFDGIVGDSSFMKPLSRESSRALEELCHREPKSNDLLYVARYLPSKGQLQFLHQVDAGLLKGYHLHFYGSDWDNVEYHEEMEQTARLRNISVSIHRSVDKKDLFRHYCRASGHIHYAQADNVRPTICLTLCLPFAIVSRAVPCLPNHSRSESRSPPIVCLTSL